VWSICLHQSVTPYDRNSLCTWMKEVISDIVPIDPLSCGRFGVFTKKYIFENIKHFVQDIDTERLSLLHHVLKDFASPTSHIVQQFAHIVTWLQPSVIQ
jgi:hypothetical protein